MGLVIPKLVSRRFWEKIMSDAQGASLPSPASPNPHMQNKITQVSAKSPVQLWSCCTEGLLNFWGKEAGQELEGTPRGHRDLLEAGPPSKRGDAHRYDLSAQSQLQGWVVSYCNP